MGARQQQREASVLFFRREQMVDGVHLARIALSRGENSSFHYHTATRDTFLVMSGALTVDIRVAKNETAQGYRGLYSTPPEVSETSSDSIHRIQLRPGEVLIIECGVVHCAMNLNEDPCHFLCVEGIGPYDFIEV